MSASVLMSRLGIAAVVVLASGCTKPGDASYSETIRLVRSMREDELLMAGLQAKAEEELRADKNNTRAACLANAKYPFMTDAIALVMSSQLTDAEVVEGIEFYRSSAGRKLVDQAFRKLVADEAASPAAFTKEEQAAVREFEQRSVGRKILKEHIAQQSAVMEKIDARVEIAVNDCLEAISPFQNDAFMRPKTCVTAPVVSPDNACSVEQHYNSYPPPKDQETTSISADCVNGGSETLITYEGHVKIRGLKWLGERTVELSVPYGLKTAWDNSPRSFRLQLKESRAAGPPQQCWPYRGRDSNHVEMDSSQAQPFWMSYADKERCILGKRNDLPTASAPSSSWVMQFRQVKANELPFVTTQLVFFESFSTQNHTRAVRIRDGDTWSVELTPGGPHGFHLVGAPAEALLKRLAGHAALTMEFQPAESEAFSVPLDKTDLEWARPQFEACVRAL